MVLVFTLVALSGCSIFEDRPPTDSSTDSSSDPVEEVDPVTVDEPAPEAVSEDRTEYSIEEEQLIYYGDVLAYRYGIEVPPDEWLSVAKKECDSYSEAGSTRVYGPAAAEQLGDDPRSSLLVESFVFMVIGSYWCGTDNASENVARYGSEAQLISLAFMETVNAIGSTNLSVADFSDYYDNQLFITRQEFAAPEEPDNTVPSVPDDPYSGPYDEYEGNAGGPTVCKDGTISQSSGQGTCSWHVGER